MPANLPLLCAFQFPTGWNSTHRKQCPWKPRNLFQFPTGWNSTRRAVWILWEISSFNSQRDGILQMALDYPALLFQVSIPNGMEFYLRSFPPRIDCEQVSIPNGMEFYGTTSTQFLIFKMFQFPTGWNSTMNWQNPKLLLLFEFQFPTGWNSTHNQSRETRLFVVSIPNGMEFYRLWKAHISYVASFNSQRDGILR